MKKSKRQPEALFLKNAKGGLFPVEIKHTKVNTIKIVCYSTLKLGKTNETVKKKKKKGPNTDPDA